MLRAPRAGAGYRQHAGRGRRLRGGGGARRLVRLHHRHAGLPARPAVCRRRRLSGGSEPAGLYRGPRPDARGAHAGGAGRRGAERARRIRGARARGARAPRDAVQRNRHFPQLGRPARAPGRRASRRRLRGARPAGPRRRRGAAGSSPVAPGGNRTGTGGTAMILPPFLIGAALAFWGWQSDHSIAGIALGVVLEAPRYLKLRLDLGAVEHSRIADLSTIGFVALVVLLAADSGVSRGILEGFTWAPAALAPVMLAQMLSESGRIPLSALFRYLRKLRRRNPQIKDPPVDVSAVYAALALISAGVANARGPAYYAGVVIAAGWALYAVRPRHSSPAAWALMLAVGAGAGYAGQLEIAELQAQLESWVVDLYLPDLDADPYRSVTEIGSIGRLKQYDAILLRGYAPEGGTARG